MRQKGTKMRPRPPRHQQQVIFMPPQGKSDFKSSHQRRIPYPMPPSRPHRPPPPMNSVGPVQIFPTVPRPVVHHMKPNYPQQKMHPPLISHPPLPPREVVGESKPQLKHQSSSPNFVEAPMFHPPMDSNQHGYMSPSYTGWKPIARPFYSFKSQHEVQESKGDPYIHPSTESNNENLMMNTLFRDNVKHIKPHKSVRLKAEYSDNRGVTIALPPEVGESVQIPSSVFFDPPYHAYQRPVNLVISQSQEKPVTVKPFPKFNSKPKSADTQPYEENTTTATTPAQSSPQLLSKFKISRPKLRVPLKSKDNYNNDPEIEGLQHIYLPKVTLAPGTIGSNPNARNNSKQVYVNSEVEQLDSVSGKVNRVKARHNTKNKEFSPDAMVDVDTLTDVLGQRQKGPSSSAVSGKEEFNHFPQESPNPTVIHDPNATLSPFPFPSPPAYLDEYRTDNFQNNFGRNVHQTLKPSTRDGYSAPNRNKHWYETTQQTTSTPERGRRRKPKNQITTRVPGPVPTISSTTSEKPIYPTDFFIPPGFTEASTGSHHPISFMTMPNSEPHVIHHDSYKGYNQQRAPQVYHTNGIKSDAEFRDNHFGSISSPSNLYPKNKYQYRNTGRTRGERFYQSSPPTSVYPSLQTTPASAPLNYIGYAPHPKSNPSLDYSYRPFYLTEPSTTPPTSYDMSHQSSAFSPYPMSHASNYFRPMTGSSEETQTTPYTQSAYHPEPTNTYLIQNSNPVPNHVMLSPKEYEQIPMEYINDLSHILANDDNNLYHYPFPTLQAHPVAQEIPRTTEPVKSFFPYQNDYYKTQGHSGESESSVLHEMNKASSSNVQPHLLHVSPISLPSSSTMRTATSTSVQESTTMGSDSDAPQKWSKLIVDLGKSKYGNGHGMTKKTVEEENNATAASVSNTVSKSIQKASYSKPVVLVRNSTTAEKDKDEDALDNSIPRTVNFKNNSNLTSIQTQFLNHSTSVQTSESESISSSSSGQKPSIRKRRPGILGRRKVFSARLKGKGEEPTTDPPVTTHRPRSRNPTYRENFESLRAYNKANTLTRNSSDNFKSISSKQSIKSRIGISPTKPTKKESSISSSPPTEPVTYSESQWFRIKSLEDEENSSGRTVDLGFKEPQTLESKSHDTVENQISSTTTFPSNRNMKSVEQ